MEEFRVQVQYSRLNGWNRGKSNLKFSLIKGVLKYFEIK